MSNPYESNAEDTDAEIRRKCAILERVANGFSEDSQEYAAIVEAAEAVWFVRHNRALAKAYREYKAACNGELSDKAIADLRSRGIEPSDLDNADY